MSPHNVFERFAAYIEEEQRLGRLGQHLSALTVATLLLGPCFQRAFNHQFLGFDSLQQTEQQFAEELLQGLLAGILPTRLVNALPPSTARASTPQPIGKGAKKASRRRCSGLLSAPVHSTFTVLFPQSKRIE